MLNKVALECIPKYGRRPADEVRKWGAWIMVQAEQELKQFCVKGRAMGPHAGSGERTTVEGCAVQA